MKLGRRSSLKLNLRTLPLVVAVAVSLTVPLAAAAESGPTTAAKKVEKPAAVRPDTALGHTSIMSCASADIHSIRSVALSEVEVRNEGAPDTPALGIADMAPSTTALGPGRKTLLALGPTLGSMDSQKVKTKLSCTKDGIVMTATITRSADYHGAAAKNALWRPQVSVVFVPLRKEMHLKTVWKMRLSSGKEVHKATMPGRQPERYPIVFKKSVTIK